MEETFNKLMLVLADVHAAMRDNQPISGFIDSLREIARGWDEGLSSLSTSKCCLLCNCELTQQHATLRAADIVPPGEQMRTGIREVTICQACWNRKSLGDKL